MTNVRGYGRGIAFLYPYAADGKAYITGNRPPKPGGGKTYSRVARDAVCRCQNKKLVSTPPPPPAVVL